MRRPRRISRSFTLKRKLLVAFLFIALIPATISSIFYHVDSRKALEANVGDTYMILLAHILNNVEQRMEEVQQFTNWLYLERNIVRLMERSPENARRYDQQTIDVVYQIESQFRFLPIMEHVSAFFLLGHNGLDIRYGPDSYRINPDSFTGEPWYENRLQSGALVWGDLTAHYATRSTTSHITPVYRDFIDIHGGKALGSIVLFLNPTFFRQSYSGLVTEQPAALFIHDASGRLFFSDSSGFNNQDVDLAALLPSSANQTPYFEVVENGRSYLVVQTVSDKTNIRVTLVAQLDELKRQRQVITATTVVVATGAILLSMAFSLFLSQNLTKPIRELMGTVDKIAAGDFDQETDLYRDDEFGALGASLGRMAQQIDQLLQERLDAEQNIRKTEIKLLQSQINPHFLHNTLNSIRWMAALQGADGIRDMATCLGRLLRAVMGSVNQKITIREELALLDDYIYIQRIRYRDKITYKREIAGDEMEPAVTECLIPKFTLQPLVENAIFHGIEPKDGSGTIVVSVLREDDHLEISVWDDGVGIKADELPTLLIPSETDEDDSISQKIGLRNVENQIQLIYGAEYGLSVESEEGVYTKVSIHLPIEVSDHAEDPNR